MDDIHSLSDIMILSRIGGRIKSTRLKQNITQERIAEESGVSLSSEKKIEKGEIGSFDSLLRVLRTLGLLNVLQPLVDEEQMSPSEYYDLVYSSNKKLRKRAAGKPRKTCKEEHEW